jgi:hypothetical protein
MIRGRSQTTFTRGGGWSKKSTFCKLLYHRKCKRREVGGQKKTNLVNIVCERPLRVTCTIRSKLDYCPLPRSSRKESTLPKLKCN